MMEFVLSNEPIEPVETKDIYLHFEVRYMEEDGQYNRRPTGLKICVGKSVTLESYDALAARFEELAATDERMFMYMIGLGEMNDTRRLRFITQEEYERLYGD